MFRHPVLARGFVLVAVLSVAACSGGTGDTETSGDTTGTSGSDVEQSTGTDPGATDDTSAATEPPASEPGGMPGTGSGGPGAPPAPGGGAGPARNPAPSPSPPPAGPADPNGRGEIILYSRTTGFRHDSIPTARGALEAALSSAGYHVTSTEDPALLTDARLAGVDALVFLMTTGDAVPGGQEPAVERYVKGGGGWVGIHSASDTEYDWAFYGRLVGAYFAGHPAIQQGRVTIEDGGHRSTVGLPAQWVRTDEWYDFGANPRSTVHVLATLDETSYVGGHMGADHPIAWCHAVASGRSWYTAMGHTAESWSEPAFLAHVLGGIDYAATPGAACG